VTDSATMLRRNLRRLARYPSMTLLLVGIPIVFLVLFVYVFGGQLGAGLGHGLGGRHAGRVGYLNYLIPGILLITVAAAVQGTAIGMVRNRSMMPPVMSSPVPAYSPDTSWPASSRA